jgi:hypothetical protein
MRGWDFTDNAEELPATPRDEASTFLLIVGIACCSVLVLAALGSF